MHIAPGAAHPQHIEQDDTKAFPDTSRLFKWHRDNEASYKGLSSGASIALYSSHKSGMYRGRTASAKTAADAFRGAYRALAEARIPFDFVSDEIVDTDGIKALEAYKAIIMPNITCLSDAEAKAIDEWVSKGGALLVTGETGFYDARGNRRAALALTSLSH